MEEKPLTPVKENTLPVAKEKKRKKNAKTRNKHKKLARALVKHDMDKRAAYAEVYPMASRNTVASQAYQIHANYPDIMEDAQALIQNALNKQDMAINDLAVDLKEVIDNPTKEVQTPQGISTLRDQNIKLKAVSKAFDLHTGNNPNQQGNTTNNVQININEATTDKLNSVLSSLKDMSNKLGITEDVQDGEIVLENVVD